MHDRQHAHANQTQSDDGPTLLFQRNLPGQGERCTLCPFNKGSIAIAPAAGTPPPRPVLPFPTIDPPHRPTTHPAINPTTPHTATTPHTTIPPSRLTATTHPPSRHNHAPLVAPTNAPAATLPRPALLTADLRGSGTLVLPDALRSAGPDAATIEQPQGPAHHPIDTRRHSLNGMAARDPDFDELASPDITVLQPVLPAAIRPVQPTRARRSGRVVSTRAYLALNVCLGLLIVAGLVLLAIRDVPSVAPGISASE